MNTEFQVTIDYKGHKLYNFMHIDFSKDNDILCIIVPGIFGDRCDSRAMFVKLARELATNNCNVLRFDFLGAGIAEGEYCQNTFSVFTDTLDTIIIEMKEKFSFIKKFVLIAFSDGLKACFSLQKKTFGYSCDLFLQWHNLSGRDKKCY